METSRNRRRGITPAEFVRNAVLAATEGESGTFPPETTDRGERIYRGVYFLATLKRNEMIRDGRREALDRSTKAARKSRDSIAETSSE